MAATGYTPIQLYSSSTPSQAPLAINLTNNTLGSEVAINIADGKLFYKDASNNVQVIATKDAAAGNFTTVDTTNLEVTNIKAKDGTASASIADSTGVISISTQLNVDNLRLDGNTLSSTDSNGNVVIAPNGTGDVYLDADTVRLGDSNANATLTTNGTGDLILNTNSGTNAGSITLANGANGNITIAPNGTGDVYIDADTTRLGDPNANATLTTNGTGDLILNTNSGTNSGSITIEDGVNGNIIIAPNGSGQVQITNAALDLTTIEVTNIKAKDGTASMTLADSTGVVSFTANPILSGGTANGVLYLNASKVATSDSAITFDGTNFATTGTVSGTKLIPTGGAVTGNGMYLPAANAVSITTNGTQAIYIDSSQNVGIGTSSPIYKLQVNIASSGTLQSGFVVSNAVNADFAVKLKTNETWIGSNVPASLIFANSNSYTERMRIDTNGNVGIATSSPRFKLSIGSTSLVSTATPDTIDLGGTYSNSAGANAKLRLVWDGSSVVYGLGVSANQLDYIIGGSASHVWYSNGSERMRIDSSGNVGIGTSSPTVRLQVTSGTTGTVAIQSSGSSGSYPTAGAGLELVAGSAADTDLIQTYNRDTSTYRTLRLNSLQTVFLTSNSEKMRLTSTGLGIGTNSPSYLLDVSGTIIRQTYAGAPSTFLIGQYDATGNVSLNNQANANFLFGTNNTERMRIDSSGRVGIGVVPAAWGSGIIVSQIRNSGLVSFDQNGITFVHNAYYNGTNWIYLNTAYSSVYSQVSGQHQFYTAASGTAGNTITYTQAMTLNESGNLGIGTTAPTNILSLGGNAARTIWMERHTTSNTAGNNLTVQSGGATSGATDKNGGTLVLSSGTATGSGSSIITFLTATAGAAGTADRAPAEKARIDGSGNLLVGTTTNTNSSKIVSSGTISETVGSTQYLVASQYDVGTAANQIPLNQYLGALAYQDTTTPPLAVGTGITGGTGTICKANAGLNGGIYTMTILIDLTGLNSGGTAGDIIGVNGTANPCYIALMPAMTVLGGRMTCLETPAGGDTDIDLYSATEGTGVEDQAITALTETQIINAGAQTVGTVTYFAADPAANTYFYLVGQGTANATYTAGRFLIEIFGV